MPQELETIDAGSTSLEDFSNQIFYGVKRNLATGKVIVDKIAGDGVITLPDATINRGDADYVNWMWTYNNLRFSWQNGHLLMEVL